MTSSKTVLVSMNSCALKFPLKKLENIEEDRPAKWLPVFCPPPETPTESMEFLARSWSLSSMEVSKALSDTHVESDLLDDLTPLCHVGEEIAMDADFKSSNEGITSGGSSPISPRKSDDMKEMNLLHQALNPDFLASQQILKNGLYKSIMRGKMMKNWLKDQKERKKQETRTQNAQLHAAVSVVGVAAAVAALTALTVTSSSDMLPPAKNKAPSNKMTAAIASAAALVASHCIEIAEEMGADHDQILNVVNSAVSARSNGDIMTLTAGAATALRGAATLKARMQEYGGGTIVLANDKFEEGKESDISYALNFVSHGGELLKRTRQGALHWKLLSFNINSNWQVVAKMKSKHMAGTFTKKKKCVVTGVYTDMPTWQGREREEGSEQRSYFGIETVDRIIEFECRNKEEGQMWTQGILHMLQCRENIM